MDVVGKFLRMELKKEDFVYRLSLARFGQIARLHFREEESES